MSKAPCTCARSAQAIPTASEGKSGQRAGRDALRERGIVSRAAPLSLARAGLFPELPVTSHSFSTEPEHFRRCFINRTGSKGHTPPQSHGQLCPSLGEMLQRRRRGCAPPRGAGKGAALPLPALGPPHSEVQLEVPPSQAFCPQPAGLTRSSLASAPERRRKKTISFDWK